MKSQPSWLSHPGCPSVEHQVLAALDSDMFMRNAIAIDARHRLGEEAGGGVHLRGNLAAEQLVEPIWSAEMSSLYVKFISNRLAPPRDGPSVLKPMARWAPAVCR